MSDRNLFLHFTSFSHIFASLIFSSLSFSAIISFSFTFTFSSSSTNYSLPLLFCFLYSFFLILSFFLLILLFPLTCPDILVFLLYSHSFFHLLLLRCFHSQLLVFTHLSLLTPSFSTSSSSIFSSLNLCSFFSHFPHPRHLPAPYATAFPDLFSFSFPFPALPLFHFQFLFAFSFISSSFSVSFSYP